MSAMTPIKEENDQSARVITVPDFETMFADYTKSQPQEDEFASPVGKELL